MGLQLNTPVLRTKNCRFYTSSPSKTVFFPCRQPYSLPPYNPTTMTIPHTLAKRPSLNEKAVLPHNSHLCLLSSFTITTITIIVILIFLMKEGKGPKGLGVIVSPTIAVAVLSLLATTVHCPLSTVNCRLSTVAFTITVTMQSLSCHRPRSLLHLLHQCSSYHQYCTAATPGSHCHCTLCTMHCRCHNRCRYAVPTLSLSTVTVTPLFTLGSPL